MKFLNESVKQGVGVLVAVILTLDGVLHAYWASGHVWPAADPRALILAILNIDDPSLARPGVVGPLAGLLFLTALVLARVGLVGGRERLIPQVGLQVVVLAVAAGAFARTVAGIIWALGLGADPATQFYKLNLILYTPACFLLFAAAAIAATARYSPENKGSQV